MLPILQPSADTCRLNHRLLLACLDGMDDAAAQKVLAPDTNHAAFITLHLVDARCFLLKMLGEGMEHPFGDAYDDAKGIEDIEHFPTIDELRAAWKQTGSRLKSALENATREWLAAKPPFKMPMADQTCAGAVAFLAQHESYHIGQLALLRKGLGLGPMSYD